jgi:hypothetical protein
MASDSLQKLGRHAVDLIRFYYEDLGNRTGGNLHVVLDDGNLDDDCIEVCETLCKEEHDSFGLFLCEVLKSMSVRKRQAVYTKFWA